MKKQRTQIAAGEAEAARGGHDNAQELARIAAEAIAARQLSDGLFDTIGALAMVMDKHGNILRLNAEAERFMGYSLAEVQGQPYFWERFIPEDERPHVHGIFEAMRDRTIPREARNHWVSRSGERRLFHWVNTVMNDAQGQASYLITIGTDITDAQRLLEQNARLLSFNHLRARINQAIQLADDEAGLLQSICDLATRLTDIGLAWIGRPDAAGRFDVLAKAGSAIDYLNDGWQSTDASVPQGQGPAGKVWRDESPLFVVSLRDAQLAEGWRAQAARHGLAAVVSLPIKHDGRMWGVFLLYAGAGDVFDPSLRDLLAELSSDISRGLDRLEMRVQNTRLLAYNRLLAQVNAVAAHSRDTPELLQSICDLTVEVTDARLAWIGHAGPDGRIVFVAKAGPAVGYLDGIVLSADPGVPEGKGPAGQALRSGEPVFHFIYQTEPISPDWRSRVRRFGIAASAALPIVRDGRVWGVFLFYTGRKLDFDANLRDLLADLAADIGHGIGHVETRRQNAHLLRYNALLARVNETIAQSEHEDGLLQSICELAVELTDLRLACIGQPDAQGRFVFPARAGAAGGYLDDILVSTDPALEQGQGSFGQAWRGAQPVFNVSFQQNPMARPWQDHAARFQLRSVAALPVRKRGRVWAIFGLFAAEERVFDDDLQALLIQLSNDVSEGVDRLEVRNLNKALVDYSDAGISIVRHRTLEFVNRRFAQMFGGDDPAQFTGVPMRALYADDAAYARVRQREADLAHDNVVRIEAVACLRRDGTPMLLDLFGVDAGDDKRIWTMVDVSAREAQKRAYANLEKLYRALMHEADVLLQNDDEASILSETCARLVSDTMFHVAWIGRPGADGFFKVAAKAGENASLVNDIRVPLDHPRAVAAQAWRRGRTVHNNDQIAALAGGAWVDALVRHRWAAALGTPIIRDGTPWAVLVLVAPQRDVFNASTVELCERIAGLLGRGLAEVDRRAELEALRSEEARRARHDMLTGLPNRLGLTQHLAQAVARAQRRKSWLALGMLDLDDFKPVNDRFGHAAGDVLLRQLAQRFRRNLRETDFVARLGGDEFVLMFEDIDPSRATEQLEHALQRLHRAVDAPFEVDAGMAVNVGMTMGLAFYPGDTDDADTLLRLADAAMYQAKLHKSTRLHWWQAWSRDTSEGVVIEAQFLPFGPRAVQIMADKRVELDGVIGRFVDTFGRPVAEDDAFAQVIGSLSDAEFDGLRHAMAAHLRFLVHPETSALAIVEAARHPGCAHALAGITGAWLNQTHQAFQELLQSHLEHMALTARERYRLLRAVTARIELDMSAQLNAMQEVYDAYSAHLAQSPPGDLVWHDAIQSELDAVCQLPGIASCVLLRPNSEGVFIVEFSAGRAGHELAQILQQPDTRAEVHIESPTGHGLVPQAWRSHALQFTDSYLADPRTSAWHASLAKLGVRSMAALPLAPARGSAFVLAILGEYPHQFSPRWMRTFIESLRLRFIQHLSSEQVRKAPVDQDEASLYRDLLYSNGVRIVAQPVVDLQSGELIKVEVLARLVKPDGSIVMPGSFLSSFGRLELETLFRVVLDQGLAALRRWREQSIDVGLAVNLAPSTLENSACPQWVEQALLRHGLDAGDLTLEILEDEAFDIAQHQSVIEQLTRQGVQIAIDDLGSGYSSLSRLSSTAFDLVKVDQSLAREIITNPRRSLGIVHSVLQIARDLDRIAVVEGLESEALIEAVGLLGGRYGQGFAIARPMSPEDLPAWVRRPGWRARRWERPTSLLGAFAYHWMYMHKSEGSHRGELKRCPLTHFLDELGPQAGDARRWHAEVHGHDPGVVTTASRLLGEWFSSRLVATAPSAGHSTKPA